MQDAAALVRALIPVAKAAGEIELLYYRSDAAVMNKADGSPVTLADQEAEALIMERLAKIAPGVPVVGEEAVESGHIPDISSGTFFLVDPLDGTKEFVAGGPDFTVNIALLRDFVPLAGIIYAPVSGALYFTDGATAFALEKNGTERPLRVRPAPPDGLTVITTQRHGSAPPQLTAFLEGHGLLVKEVVRRSSAIKHCVIAEGLADLYPRLGPTSEWDTAAGEAILRAAGGRVTTLDGAPMVYGKAEEKFLNPSFVAWAA